MLARESKAAAARRRELLFAESEGGGHGKQLQKKRFTKLQNLLFFKEFPSTAGSLFSALLSVYRVAASSACWLVLFARSTRKQRSECNQPVNFVAFPLVTIHVRGTGEL